MKGFCPSCEKESELTPIRKVENLNIKGEEIPVGMSYFTCAECGSEFDDPDPGYDPLAAAYQEYRRRKGMVQPEEIRAFRERYGLTQRELSELLGFGGATLSRYEQGALQDQTHDTLLRLIMQPKDLLKILSEKGAALNPEKREGIIRQLTEVIEQDDLLCFLKKGRASEFTGGKEPDFNRILNAVRLFCFRDRVSKVKLNKLLFYADFKHYRDYGASITGLCYAHLPLGPVVDQYEQLFEKLTEIDLNLSKEEILENEFEGVYYTSGTGPAPDQLSYSEMQVLFSVKDYFKTFTATQIKTFSHQEKAYQQTSKGELISYRYASDLRV